MISGESFVAFGIPASSGTHFDTASSRESFPSSRSLRIARAVKLFVMDAIRKTVSASTEPPPASRVPNPFGEDELAVHDDAERRARDLLLLHRLRESLLDGGQRGDQLRAARRVGERGGRDVDGGARTRRGGACEGDECEGGCAAADGHWPPLFTFKENLLFLFFRARAARSGP